MLYVSGFPVHADDARWLADRLYQDRVDEAVSAALAIEACAERELAVVPLTREQRRAVLAVLDDPPAGLRELRTKLLQEVA